MPIFRINGHLAYFAHVPKCAGSSVEDYITTRFGTVGFLDRKFKDHPDYRQWSKTSPQHIDCATLKTLFPDDYLHVSFSVVRHPATRLLSSFHYESKLGDLSPGTTFKRWLRWNAARIDRKPFMRDGHLRPMGDFVPTDAHVFKLEDGLDAIIPWLDKVEGKQRKHISIPISNETHKVRRRPQPLQTRVLHKLIPIKLPQLDEKLCRLVYDYYKKDYERFGYGVFDPLEARTSRNQR